MNQLKQNISQIIQNDENFTISKIAQSLHVKEIDVLLNVPKEIATHTDGSDFDKIIQELQTWGEVLIIKVTKSFVFEIKSKITNGSYGHGYYNFDHDAPLSGHLKVEDIDKIVFLSAKVMSGISHSIVFFDKNGDDIFKIYVSRDEKREFIAKQLEAFLKLKKSYESI